MKCEFIRLSPPWRFLALFHTAEVLSLVRFFRTDERNEQGRYRLGRGQSRRLGGLEATGASSSLVSSWRHQPSKGTQRVLSSFKEVYLGLCFNRPTQGSRIVSLMKQANIFLHANGIVAARLVQRPLISAGFVLSVCFL